MDFQRAYRARRCNGRYSGVLDAGRPEELQYGTLRSERWQMEVGVFTNYVERRVKRLYKPG